MTTQTPKDISRPNKWDENVEEAYRFQVAGYRDLMEYTELNGIENDLDRWEHNGWIKKLKRKDGYYYYFDKTRECSDKDVHQTKMYSY